MANDIIDIKDFDVKIPPLFINADMVIDKTSVIYGPSGTGKTVLVKHIMYMLKDKIDIAIAVSPTEITNHSYQQCLPLPFIYTDVYELGAGYEVKAEPRRGRKKKEDDGIVAFLETVCKRQSMATSIYKKANNRRILEQIIQRLSGAQGWNCVDELKQIEQGQREVEKKCMKLYEGNPERAKRKIKECGERFREMVISVFKKYIRNNLDALEVLKAKNRLTEDEMYAIEYLELNPRILLIFDDCAAELKSIWRKEIFRKVFYQGRHSYITSIFCCQDNTDLPPNLRKNARLSFFTNKSVCNAYYGKGVDGFVKRDAKKMEAIAEEVFSVENRKLVYVREDEKQQNIYHIIAPKRDAFPFGSEAFREYASSIKASGTNIDTENDFYRVFSVKKDEEEKAPMPKK